jgi:membrane protease YdiL (CAAX protease family)
MKSCDYCGRENDEVLAFCAECGTALPAPPPPPIPEPPLLAPPFLPAPPPAPHILNGGIATAIFGVYLGGQVAGGAVGGFFAGLMGSLWGRARGPQEIRDTLPAMMPVVILLAMLIGGAGMFWMVNMLRLEVKDPSPTGPAWVRGSWRDIAKGFCTGAVLSTLSIIFLLNFGRDPDADQSLGPLTRMSVTSGIPQIAWVIVALFLAPPVEELLFRGILYAGYRKSLGATAATVLTTGIFVALHFDQLIPQPLAVFGISGLALAALWWRIRGNAIGPAIATHFAYNTVVVVAAFWLM